MHIIFPYLHIVSDEQLPHLKYLYRYKNIRQFKEDLENLCRQYVPISLGDLIDMQRNGSDISKNSFLLTIDDGFRENYDIVAPILKSVGVPASFFITVNFLDNKELYFGHKKSILLDHCIKNDCYSQFAPVLIQYNCFKNNVIDSIKKIDFHNKGILDIIASKIGFDFKTYLSEKKPYLSTGQVEKLIKLGFTIGAHSIDHPKYPFISKKEQVWQTVESVRLIRKKFTLHYGAFAFPHSDNGVSKDIFGEVFSSGIVDITFGTAGMIDDSEYRNIQRFSIEKPLWPVNIILMKENLRKIYRKFKGFTLNSRMY